jgi:hypothetical protein
VRCRLRCPGQADPPSAEDEEVRRAGCDARPAFHRDPAFPVDGASLLSVGVIWCRRALKPAGSMAFPSDCLECHVWPRRVNVRAGCDARRAF